MLGARRIAAWAWIVCVVLGTTLPAVAQDAPKKFSLGKSFGAGAEANGVKATGRFDLKAGSRSGNLVFELRVPDGYHIYSLKQQKPFKPTTFKLAESNEFKLLGPFTADREPHVRELPDLYDVPLEEYEGAVTFTAPLELAEGVDPETLKIKTEIVGQWCSDTKGCREMEIKTEAAFSGWPQTDVRPTNLNATLEGTLDTTAVPKGGPAKLSITVKPDADWHIYGYVPETKKDGGATLLVLTDKGNWTRSRTTSLPEAERKTNVAGQSEAVHEKPVTFVIELARPKTGEPLKKVDGYIALQTCRDKSCTAPIGVQFGVAEVPEAGVVPVSFRNEVAFKDVADLAHAAVVSDPRLAPVDWGQVGAILVFAFLGGMILNLMPCVLPVIGLKILSFARQGGQSHGRVFMLNLAYSAGLITVFLILAGLAAFLNLGWGDQFQNLTFKITMTCVVFAMALSFLGVWELPIPGFATSGKASELQNQHGYAGAFFKGMFTTVLATPCSGPFLGAVFPFAAKNPPEVSFLIFFCIGLGMALPYLIIGAFPGLVRFLPKPGEWMETFERLVGFGLLGAVVFLFSTMGKKNMEHYATPTLATLMIIWFGCWLIGRVPDYAGMMKRGLTWAAAGSMVAVVCYGSFTFLGKAHNYLKWEPYNEQKLQAYLAEGKTVMIDFTADWCLTCKFNLYWSVDTAGVRRLADKNGVITMLADKTDANAEIDAKLRSFDSESIPVLAIIPAATPNQPIILRDLISPWKVLESLEQAGPSKTAAKPESTATVMTPAMP